MVVMLIVIFFFFFFLCRGGKNYLASAFLGVLSFAENGFLHEMGWVEFYIWDFVCHNFIFPTSSLQL